MTFMKAHEPNGSPAVLPLFAVDLDYPRSRSMIQVHDPHELHIYNGYLPPRCSIPTSMMIPPYSSLTNISKP